MFLDWLERRVDPFAPFDEARMPPRSIIGFAWFYLRPIRAALAALFVIAVIAGTVEASLYLVMRWFIDLLGSADRATVLSDHAVELGLVVVLIAETAAVTTMNIVHCHCQNLCHRPLCNCHRTCRCHHHRP